MFNRGISLPSAGFFTLADLPPHAKGTPMKPKAVIITDPKKLFAICSNQPRVSREQMRKSILAGIQSGRTQSAAKTS